MSDKKKRGSDDKIANTHRNEANSSPSTNERPESPSLATRIQNSASGLAKNVFSAPGSSADSAQLLAGSSKAGHSSSHSALAAAQHYTESSTTSASPSTGNSSLPAPAEAFRSATTVQQGGFQLPPLSEDEFQRTYGAESLVGNNDSFIAGLNADESTGKGKGKGRDTATDLLSGDYTNPVSTEQRFQPDRPSLLPSDGDAVVSLLSDQSFDPEFPPTADEPADIVETELLPMQLTPEEKEMIESFRRLTPPTSSTALPSHDNNTLTSHSLVPDIGEFLDTVPSQGHSDVATLRETVLTGLPGAADWLSVEDRYHDEVWGYLRPTLEAAAKEMESNKDSGSTEEGPAVRRLKMILRHMQQ
ncbi:hypothetical protein CBS63078_9488 [Aspergillus niger]|uniref:Contig An16c0230, genomic contig n=4 Tax=Aspergillus niger TaxID=5061 RepID=A2R8H2_ASPNC|nr:uncharacterized protein An16g07140 [Aspergillus niger]XP_025459354.1 uncharacterized protein BO96DRAFT_383410 [Aspergillus niger CBS 101883]EHA21460.1 hypothetical protein ASPNIDRAFT_193955 [Aspergillus niger ATCC 1015]RDH21471.1 hypothetical protein M747DRAFT_19548 [Aspergillus niger ATCC 13496]KAI2817125.1 hypothetical protein CBS115989_6280 [Aspergillus niger]KAI2826081.1 hypothetical protein CBS133816_7841 [Aspergillus niger]KAI2843929.1 hypothetical protein CBS11350_5041 [Aspergillus |eukprot:XP_001398014.1 hypothetical protein ANI_1_1942144 [Aspergillus niger CBS 513.88]